MHEEHKGCCTRLADLGMTFGRSRQPRSGHRWTLRCISAVSSELLENENIAKGWKPRAKSQEIRQNEISLIVRQAKKGCIRIENSRHLISIATVHIMYIHTSLRRRSTMDGTDQPITSKDEPRDVCPCRLDTFVHRSSTYGGDFDPLIQTLETMQWWMCPPLLSAPKGDAVGLPLALKD